MLNQSQSQARDLAQQMGQRLKVAEAMLAEAVKARERLIADNESAVEGLLATINSKDQLLKVSVQLLAFPSRLGKSGISIKVLYVLKEVL